MIFLMLLGLVVFSLLALFIFKKSKKSSGNNKRLLLVVLSLIIFALGLEVTVFNVNFYSSFSQEKISLNRYLTDFQINYDYVVIGLFGSSDL